MEIAGVGSFFNVDGGHLVAVSDDLLLATIADRLHNSPQQRLTFAEYMEICLYDPVGGYYTSGRKILGFNGDFITSAHIGRDFGELIAVQLVDFWQALGRPSPFSIVETGAGQGLIARDILRFLESDYLDCFNCINYRIVERSASFKKSQENLLKGLPVSWFDWPDIRDDSLIGCCFSNELFDALPVHLIQMQDGELLEVYVGLDAKKNIVEILDRPSTPKIESYFQNLNIDLTEPTYPNGYRTEVNLNALDFLASMAAKLHRGFLLTIDYGHPAHRYYNPQRSQGTLLCYFQHRYHNNPYINIGQQDITSHVDFTSLEDWGEKFGLTKLQFTRQGIFLMSLGLGDRLTALLAADPHLPENETIDLILRRRQLLHSAIDPQGLGSFGVLLQGKGLPANVVNRSFRGFPTY
jgi:SAM-dependent MidA family methyltransferase